MIHKKLLTMTASGKKTQAAGEHEQKGDLLLYSL